MIEPNGAATLITPRLRLRPWRAEDRAPFAAMNADPQVAAMLGGALTRDRSDALADRIAEDFAAKGYGIWVVDAPGVADFAGCVGLWTPRFTAPFTPCVEICWRLPTAFWGRGYASEAARAAVSFGFNRLSLPEILAFTAMVNHRSRAVMDKIGMRQDLNGSFDHPSLPQDHILRRHALYRLTNR